MRPDRSGLRWVAGIEFASSMSGANAFGDLRLDLGASLRTGRAFGAHLVAALARAAILRLIFIDGKEGAVIARSGAKHGTITHHQPAKLLLRRDCNVDRRVIYDGHRVAFHGSVTLRILAGMASNS